MTQLRDELAAQLARKVDTRGLVVWDDPAREYLEVAASVCPPDATFASWEGSWYELRHQVERQLAGERAPRLVVYVPTDAPEEDPLAELREAGTAWRIRLATLIRHALAGELAEARLDEIGRQATTLAEAEAALEAGDVADVRLVGLLGIADTIGMTVTVLSGERIAEITSHDAWRDVAGMLAAAYGADLAGDGDELRADALRHLVLAELTERLGSRPDGVAGGWSAPTAEQRRRAVAALDAWRRDRRRVGGYAELATRINSRMRVADALPWVDAFADADGLPGLEELAFREALARLERDDLAGARDLAEIRLQSSLWATVPLDPPLSGAETWGPRWRVVVAVAALLAAIRSRRPGSGDAGKLLAWYSQDGWEVDREHRRLELAASRLHTEGDLEPHIGAARQAYEAWLQEAIHQFTAAARSGVDAGGLLRQSQVHDRFVARGDGPVAYVLVDALRYELGADLVEALARPCDAVELHAAVAAAPTITPVGMANICPGADTGLVLELDDNQRLSVRIGSTPVRGVPDRIALLRAAHGQVVDLTLSHVVEQGERELARKVAGARVVIVRSQEIDAVGESGMLSVTWANFETVTEQVVRAVARLGQAGIRRVVIVADHGFVALSRGLRSDRIVDRPAGGTGELHRRGWVGRGGTTSPATVRVPLADTGVTSDLDLIVPAGLAVFAGPGARQFFHGGLCPQELVVPVIVGELRAPAGAAKRAASVQLAGERITTGVFSVSVTFQPDLFTSELEVRVVGRRRSDGEPVARVVAGDGYDRDSGTVRLSGDRPSVLTLQVTGNLDRGAEVDVAVLDAGSDRDLAATTATAASAIVVEEDLD